MIYVGIDVSKDKHDCFAIDSNGEILLDNITIQNNCEGFQILYNSLLNFSNDANNISIGMEATGHYSNNIFNFLTEHGFNVSLINPLQTNLYRKGQSLRKTKTDKLDSRLIATMLMSKDLPSYVPLSYHISELKSLTRHRFRLNQECTRFKISLSRFVTIVFPELPDVVSSISSSSMLAMLSELPSTEEIAKCNLKHLTNILLKNSHSKYGRDKAIEIRDLAKNSIGTKSQAISMELQQVISIIKFIELQLKATENKIKESMKLIDSPILSIPGISYTLAAIIQAEINDINRFENPAKLLAFAGLDPSTYQSGKFTSSHQVMIKRGSKYLRYALILAARTVCMNDSSFKAFRDKKLSEGKHYTVAMSHVAKKLVRVIYYLLQNNTTYDSTKIA